MRFMVSLVSLGAVISAAACSRTPPEPAPSTTAAPDPLTPKTTSPAHAAASSSAGASGQCIAKMAETAPPVPPPAKACPPDPEPGTSMPTGEIAFPEASPTLKIQAELAKTEHDIEKGLMYRRSMSDNQGMFFKLDSRRVHTFWMHNTCIPLDMMFVEEDGLIVGIVEGAAPLTDDVRSVGCPSSYVLEVNGGWSRKNGVKPGQRITIPFSAR